MSFLSNFNPQALYVKAIVALSTVLIIVGAYFLGHWIGHDAGFASCNTSVLENNITKLTDHAKDLATQQATFNESVDALNKHLADHSQTTQIINTRVEKEVAKNIYRDIIVPVSGMQLLADNANTLNSKRMAISPAGELSRNSSSGQK